MIIEPKIRGFICTTAHPDGCAEAVREQIEYVKGQPKTDGAKKALILGASTGYGLAPGLRLPIPAAPPPWASSSTSQPPAAGRPPQAGTTPLLLSALLLPMAFTQKRSTGMPSPKR